MTTTDNHTGTAVETPDLVTLSGRAVARLVELLDHCHAFLDTHQGVTAELDEYCTSQPATEVGRRQSLGHLHPGRRCQVLQGQHG
jgi:hypothetical protein